MAAKEGLEQMHLRGRGPCAHGRGKSRTTLKTLPEQLGGQGRAHGEADMHGWAWHGDWVTELVAFRSGTGGVGQVLSRGWPGLGRGVPSEEHSQVGWQGVQGFP